MAFEKKEKKSAHVDLGGLSLSDVVETLNKKYGKNTLVLASKAAGLEVQMLSTGNYALDIALGGGVPQNRITEFHGAFSTLKTTTVLNIIVSFQKKYPGEEGMVFYEDGEHAFDPKYARRIGVDLERIAIINSDSGEQAIDVLSDITSLRVHILTVVDSIATLIPTAEIEASAEQQFQGLHPRLIAKMMRILTARQKRSLYESTEGTTTILATNQVRSKLGVVYGDPTSTPGGQAKDHYYSIIVRFLSSPSDRIMEKITKNGVEREIRMGQGVRFTVKKNKVSGSQHEEGSFTYFIRPYKGHAAFSFDNEEVLMRLGKYYGVIEPVMVSSKLRFRYHSPNFQESEFQGGEDSLLDALKGTQLGCHLYSDILKAIEKEEDELFDHSMVDYADGEDEVVEVVPRPKRRLVLR